MRRTACTMVLLLALGACSSDTAAESSTSRATIGETTTTFPRTVTEQGLTFTVPDELTFRSEGFTASIEAVDGYYANFAVRDGCQGNNCGGRFNLPDNGVLLSFGTLADIAFAPQLAPNARIAGHAARVTTDVPGDCGGDETITVWITTPNGSNVPKVVACLSGPDLGSGERIVQEMIDSAT